jgi:DNA-binding NtrC family response regulator
MDNTPAILLVDDDPAVLDTLAEMLRRSQFDVRATLDGAEAIELAGRTRFDVAVVDQRMPGLSGIETTRRLKEISPDLEVIILTGHPSLESSLEAIHEHVFDYLCKPTSIDDLTRAVTHAAERRGLVLQNRDLVRQLEIERNRLRKRVTAAERVLERHLAASYRFVGVSEAIARVRRQVAEVAPTDMTVLLRGESGTGKDVVARVISELSSHGSGGPFVKINCPAIPETLLESELFGHEAGAFTGAERRKPGRFELATDGTVFMDEVGEIPLALQTKLLQVIEQKEFTRLGGSDSIRVSARIVAATNAPLETMIASGQFRADLFYRLNEYTIVLPPLRQRTEDIPLLVEHFLSKHGDQHGPTNLTISPSTMAQLVRYRWPGNVRELEAVVRRFTLTGHEESIIAALDDVPSVAPVEAASHALRESEIQTILGALTQCRWNQRQAAKVLGISYSSLRRRIAKFNLMKRPPPPLGSGI